MFKAKNCFPAYLSYQNATMRTISTPLTTQHRLHTAIDATELERAKPFTDMPGYSKWQIFRAFMPGGKFYKKEFTHVLRTVNNEFGDLAFIPGILGLRNTIIISNPDDIETVFRSDGVWPARNSFLTVNHHRLEHRKEFYQGHVGLLGSNDEKWGSFRSIVNPVLMQPKTTKNYLNRLSVVSDEFVQRIKDIREPTSLEVPADFVQEIGYWTLESVAVVALDTHLGLINKRTNNEAGMTFIKHLNKFFELFVALEIKPSLWKVMPTPKFKQMMVSLDGLTDFVDTHMQEAIKRLNAEGAVERPDSEKSVLEKLVKIDPKIATVMAMDIFFGGVDTTTTAFTGIMLCLAKFPEKQAKLREEILQILPEKNSQLTEETIKHMPYLRACIKEAMRMYPLGPGLVRTCSKDIVIGGYRVPKGTDFTVSNFLLLQDPTYFPKPNEYIPERFLRQAKSAEKTAFVFFPFGFGPRSCVGKRIVEMELEIMVSKIVRNFQVEFNYSTENIFKNVLINVPAKPLQFKFTDLEK